MDAHNNALDLLNWDSEEPLEFGAEVPAVSVQEQQVEKTETAVTDSSKEEKKEPAKTPAAKEEKTADEILNWNDENETVKNEKPDEEDDSEETKGVNPLDATIEFFQKNELINVALEEGVELKDLTDDEKQQFIEEGLEAAMDLKIETLTKGLSPVAKNILKIASKGEDVDAYIASLVEEDDEFPTDLDMSDEENQIYVLRSKLKAEGNDEEFIDTYIENLKNNNKLKSVADKEFNRQLEIQKKKQADEQKRIDTLAKEKREKEFQYKSSLSDILKKNAVVSGVKLSNKEISELPDYLSRTTVEIAGGRKITPFYQDFIEILKDNENTLLLAKVVKDIKAGKGLSSIQASVESDTTKKFRTTIQRQQGSNTEASGRKFSMKGKSLADVI